MAASYENLLIIRHVLSYLTFDLIYLPIMKDLKHTGFWKFEGDDNSYSGTLEYVDGSFELTLLGRPEMSSTFKEIYGCSSDGTNITLYNCYARSRHMSLPGIPTTRIMAQLCLLGHHFKLEEAKFEKIRMVYSSLNEWFDRSGFHDFKVTYHRYL